MNVIIAIFGMVMLACAYLVLAASNTKWMVFLALPFDAFHALSYSAMRIIIANLVPTSDVGNLM